jgi:hypothetical protein
MKTHPIMHIGGCQWICPPPPRWPERQC